MSDAHPLQWERDGVRFNAAPRDPQRFDRVSAVTSAGVGLRWRSQDIYQNSEGEIAFARISVSGLKELMLAPGVAAEANVTPDELAS